MSRERAPRRVGRSRPDRCLPRTRPGRARRRRARSPSRTPTSSAPPGRRRARRRRRGHARGARRGGRRRARDRHARPRATCRCSSSPPSAGLPAFCEKPVALDLATLDALARGGRARRDPRPGRLPAALRRRLPRGARRGRRRRARQPARRSAPRRTIPSRPRRRTSPRRAGSSATSTSTTSTPIRFVTGEEVAEVYADGAVRETPWFERHDDVDAAAAILRLQRRGARGLDRDAPRPARLRRPARGLRHPGQHRRRRRRAHAASLAWSRARRGPTPAGTATSSTASTRPTARSSRPSSRPSRTAARARARSRRRARRCVVALAADRSRAERRPVSIEEVTSAEAVAG